MRQEKFYIGYCGKNRDLGVFTDINEYRLARETYTKGGRLTKFTAYSLPEATTMAKRIIIAANPTIPEDAIDHYIKIKANNLYSMDELMKSIPDEVYSYANASSANNLENPPYEIVID